MLKLLEEWGLGEITLKSDNEGAIDAVKKGIKSRRKEKTLLETAPQMGITVQTV